MPQGNVLPLVSALTLKNKYPFYGLVSDMVFTFFAFLLVISLSKMALKHSAQVRSSVSKHRLVVYLTEKIHVFDEVPSGTSYSAVGHSILMNQ